MCVHYERFTGFTEHHRSSVTFFSLTLPFFLLINLLYFLKFVGFVTTEIGEVGTGSRSRRWSFVDQSLLSLSPEIRDAGS